MYTLYSHSALNKMDFKTVLLVLTLLAGCYGDQTAESEVTIKDNNDLSIFFRRMDRHYVVGGKRSIHGSHPYAVVLTTGPYVRGYLCGGSLISQRTILTAAHCIDAIYINGSLDSTVRVVVGTNLWAVGGTEYRVERNVTHPEHMPSLRTNDIGLLITTTNIEFSDNVQPVALSFEYIGSGVLSRVAAWGNTKVGGDEADDLQEVEVSTIDGLKCVDAAAQAVIELKMKAPPVDPAVQVCTMHEPGRGTCNGDSGSALIRASDDTQIGVVSWGFPCALGAPDIFARVSAYKEFIETNRV